MGKKRDFKENNPAIELISNSVKDKENIKTQDTELENLKARIKELERKQEARSQRVNLLLRPTDVREIKEEAKNQNLSMNRLVENILREYLDNKKESK